MNVEDRYRTVLEQLTEEPVGGPDLTTSLAGGRRRRRVRRTVVAGGAVAALAVAVAGGAWLQRPHDVIAPDSFASAPSYQDFVPGTQIDEDLQATIAQHLPGLSPATKVYASDWNHDGPLPDARAVNATDWEAFYTLTPDVHLFVTMGKKIPGEPFANQCTDFPDTGQPACHVTDLPDGSRMISESFEVPSSDQPYWFNTVLIRPDGSRVTANQSIAAGSWADAEGLRTYDATRTAALVQDPSMTFPDPLVTPPAPTRP